MSITQNARLEHKQDVRMEPQDSISANKLFNEWKLDAIKNIETDAEGVSTVIILSFSKDYLHKVYDDAYVLKNMENGRTLIASHFPC